MIWFLFFIAFDGATPDFMMYPTSFDTMEACFEHREKLVRQIGNPYDNQYQLVCVTKEPNSV